MFEYDGNKSRSNQRKHGIDFEAAQALWDDPDRIEVPAKHVDEPRIMVIGRIERQHWSAVITYRGGTIRLISVRPATRQEINAYES